MSVHSQRGFSLLEVIIAIAVLAFAMTALVEGAGRGAFNANHLKEKTLAHWVALNKVAEYQLQPTWPAVGIQKGTYDMAEFDWRWEARVSETEDQNVHRLEMEVRTGPNSKQVMAKLTAFLDNPANQGEAAAPGGGRGGSRNPSTSKNPGASNNSPGNPNKRTATDNTADEGSP